jgi:hypothetical protein
MKYYIIYKDSGFIGYTTNKVLVNNFLKTRKGNYHVEKIDEKDISNDIKNSSTFFNCELFEYINYHTDNDTVLFEYEARDMEENIIKDMQLLQELIVVVMNNLKYIQLSKDEEKLIKYVFYTLFEDLDTITNSDEVIFYELINIKKYFYERYLPYISKNSFINNE